MIGDAVALRRAVDNLLSNALRIAPPGSAVTVAGGLEPAYTVAGDSLDYAVDSDVARFAVFDGMGHGLASAQLTNKGVGPIPAPLARRMPTTTAAIVWPNSREVESSPPAAAARSRGA